MRDDGPLAWKWDYIARTVWWEELPGVLVESTRCYSTGMCDHEDELLREDAHYRAREANELKKRLDEAQWMLDLAVRYWAACSDESTMYPPRISCATHGHEYLAARYEEEHGR